MFTLKELKLIHNLVNCRCLDYEQALRYFGDDDESNYQGKLDEQIVILNKLSQLIANLEANSPTLNS